MPQCQMRGQNLVKPRAAHVLLNQFAGGARTVRESSSSVCLRDSLRDVENLGNSSLECPGTERGDQSLLEWMNSTAKGAVLGMQIKCYLQFDFWSRQALCRKL